MTATSLKPISVSARIYTWWVILRIALEERFVYRGDFALGTLMRFLPIITQIFLWHAIFSASGKSVIEGYTHNGIIAYYMLTMVSRAFSSMPGLCSGIALQVRNGEVKKFLIQPVDMLGFLLLGRIAHKAAYYTIAIIPFAFVFFLCRGFFAGWPELEVFLAFCLSLGMGFLLGFFIEASLGLVAFWFLEVSSLVFIYNLLNFFLSGHMFPLDLLPLWARDVVGIMPFQYLAYLPAAIFLGKIESDQLWMSLGMEACWLCGFILLARAMFRRGVVRYSGFGG
ncbi:MAG: ABC-2 family transporter protein [Planctomycetota bacterium]|nr:ABC-2 family transporter protein [Planctomycetota bacterium]